MTDLELLFLVLILIYGWECSCWLPRGSIGFVTWMGRKWRIAHPATLLGNQQGGFVLASPLPPLGTLLTGNQLPLSLSADAVLVYVASAINPGGRPLQSGKLFRLEEIRTIEAKGKKLKINGEFILKTASPTFAQHLGRILAQLQKLPRAKRAQFIEETIRAAFDLKKLESRRAEFQPDFRQVRLLANALFAYLFVFSPVLIWQLGLKQCWLGLVIGLVALTSTAGFFFRRAHKKLFPSAEDDRFTHSLTVMLSPATAARAHDLLSRPLLEEFHPLAIAHVVCDEKKFVMLAERMLREVRHPALPVCPRPEPAAMEAERATRLILQRTVEEFLKRNGLDLEKLARPPERSDENCRSYCPHCLAQFVTEQGSCGDCGGLPVEPFASAMPPKEAIPCKQS